MALVIDSTPTQTTGTTQAITSASFTVPDSSILVALLTANNNNVSGDVTWSTVTNTGTSLTWTRRARKNVNAGSDGGAGTSAGAEIWTAFNTTSQSITVTATNSDSVTGVSHEKAMQIVVFTGGDQTQLSNIITAFSASGLPSATLTGCTTGSYVIAVSSDWAQAGLGTVGSGQTMISETDIAGQISSHKWRITNTLSSSGSQTMNLTAPSAQNYNLCVIEILAVAGGAPAGSGTIQAAQPFPVFRPPFIDPTASPFQLQGDASTQGPVAITLSDTGAGADTITVLIEADPNQAPELFAWMFLEPSGASFQLQGDTTTNAATPITLTDVGAGSDVLTVSAAVPLTDTGAGVDSLTALAAVPFTDAGAGNDNVTVAADVPLTDAGTTTDSISVNTGTDSYQAWPQNFPAFTAPFIEPTATPFQLLGDRSTGIILVSLSDTGTGDDQLAITAIVPLTDIAVGADSLTLTTAVPLGDTGAGADALAATAVVPITDVGTGDDQLSVLTLTVTDPNQAPLQRFGWGLLRPDGHIPFQLLGDANARQPETGGGTLTVTDRALVTFGAGDRDIADLGTGVRQIPTLGGGE